MNQAPAATLTSRLVRAAADFSRARDWIAWLRLASGLTMFTFVATHFTHHALGLVSLDAMEKALFFFLSVWTSQWGMFLLGLALTVHLTLVATKVIQRTTLRMPAVEWLRLTLGMVTLCLLTVHVLSNAYLYQVLDLPHGYAPYLLNIWPWAWPLQFTLLVSAWTHGCIGVHLWLRLRPMYRRTQAVWLALAVLLPALALTGLLSAREVSQARTLDAAWAKENLSYFTYTPAIGALLLRFNLLATAAVVSLICAVFGARRMLVWHRALRGVRIRYPGRVVIVPHGTKVLEASRMHGIPHASVCGGRGRCSTCRIRILSGYETVAPAGEEELRVLRRIGAPERVRLACQVRCERELEVVPLVPPNAGPDAARPQGRFLFGTELDIAILFSDIRDFTRLSEQTLAYDVVHILNQYFEAMSEAIEAHEGYVDKFIGDGMMALFGLRRGAASGCRSALAAAREMSVRLADLNARLGHSLREPLRIGIGIHAGMVVAGEMGHKTATSLTVVGDAVNTASRVEGLTKQTGTQLVVTARVAELAGVDLSRFTRFRAAVKGKEEELDLYAVPSAQDLPERLAPPGAIPAAGAALAPKPAVR